MPSDAKAYKKLNNYGIFNDRKQKPKTEAKDRDEQIKK